VFGEDGSFAAPTASSSSSIKLVPSEMIGINSRSRVAVGRSIKSSSSNSLQSNAPGYPITSTVNTVVKPNPSAAAAEVAQTVPTVAEKDEEDEDEDALIDDGQDYNNYDDDGDGDEYY
jgi:hypothetical protein